MVEKATYFHKKPSHWILTSCPSTHEEVVGSGWYQQFSIPDGYATWWYCPSCRGWHVRQLPPHTSDECTLEKVRV